MSKPFAPSKRRAVASHQWALRLVQLACLTASVCVTAATIAPAVQAERDAERLRILRNELTREQDALAEAAKRRAERLAASDMDGVRSAEAMQVRATDNVAALRREIGSVAGAASPVDPAAAKPATRDSSPWWDVYSRPVGRAPFVNPAPPATPGSRH